MIPKLGKDLKTSSPTLTIYVPCSTLQDFSMGYRVIKFLLHIPKKSFILLSNEPRSAHVFHPFVSDLGCRHLEIMLSTGDTLEVRKYKIRSMRRKILVPKVGCSGILRTIISRTGWKK